MGDDVKITVIATGFKQQEMPERRERMLAETTMPGSRYDVPVQPRVPAQRFPVNREHVRTEQPAVAAPAPVQRVEATSVREQRVAEPAVRKAEAASEVTVRPEPVRSPSPSSPELLPVRASVFDDEFFRSSVGGATAAATPEPAPERRVVMDGGEGRAWEAQDFSGAGRVQEDSGRGEAFGARAAEAPLRTPEFAGAETERAEPDELDIPAFLRRGN